MRRGIVSRMFFLAFALIGAVTSGGEVKLTVDWGGVTMPGVFPVTGGVPLSQGALKDASAVRLLVSGREVPLQTEVLAVWPDKSIKWLLLDFQVVPGQKDLALQYGSGVKTEAAAKGILAVAGGSI